MKKWKVIFVIVLLAAIAALAGLGLFGNKEDRTVTESIGLIPVDANMIIEIRDFVSLSDRLKEEPNYWTDLCGFPNVQSLKRNINLLDSIRLLGNETGKLLDSQTLIVSIHDAGKNQLGAIFLIPIPESIKSEALVKDLQAMFEGKADIKLREYDNHDIYDLKMLKGKRYAFAVVDRNLIWSRNSLLVEKVVRQSNTDISLIDNADFQNTYRTAGEKEVANVYINLNRLRNLLLPFFNESMVDKHPAFNQYASWMTLDLSFKEKTINLNGFVAVSDSSSMYLQHLMDQESINSGFETILPEGTALFYTQSISDVKEFKKVRKEFLSEIKYLDYFDENDIKIQQKIHSNMADFVYGSTEDEICFAISNINQLDIFQNAYLLISTQSKSKTQEMIEELLSTYTTETSQNMDDYVSTIDLGVNHQYPLYRLPVGNWPGLYFGSFYSAVQADYCIVINNYLVFGRNKASLTRFVNSVLLNKTLEKSPAFQDFKKNLSRQSQATFYVNVQKAIPWIQSILNQQSAQKLMKHEAILQHFHEFAVQQVVSENMIYHNIAIQHREIQFEAPHTVWESRLDTSVRMKPVIVLNHNSNEKEIMVQDVNHNLYLINKNGIVLWKIPMDEEIVGEIHQVDAFKNRKLQYLFNTRTKIYLIDRLGNHVERFPVSLRSPASCGLALFDYDQSRDYRICVPTEDKQLYMYNIEGNLISGWEFEGSEHPLTIPPQHIRNKSKDYIVFHDKHRIYLLNRKGESRVQPKRQFSASKRNKFWFQVGSNDSKAVITTTDKRGVVFHTYLDGNVDTVFFHPYSENHFFMYRDFNADSKPEYIFFDNKRMEVYDENKKELMTYDFENNISVEPDYYKFSSSNHKIGIVDENAAKMYLINPDGSLHKGFPLTGSSPFSISYMDDHSDHFNLFVGGKGKFLYNYEVK